MMPFFEAFRAFKIKKGHLEEDWTCRKRNMERWRENENKCVFINEAG